MKRQSKETKRANSPKRTKSPSKNNNKTPYKRNKKLVAGAVNLNPLNIVRPVNEGNEGNEGYEGQIEGLPSFDRRFIKMYLITREQIESLLLEPNYLNKKIYIIRNKRIDNNVFANQGYFLNTDGVISYPIFNNGNVSFSHDLIKYETIQEKIRFLRENGYVNIDEL